MKIRFSIKREVLLPPNVLGEKIDKYLKKNFYRVVDRGDGFVIFIDDEYSDRKRFRSDYHTRIGKGKFEFYANERGARLKLIYFTPVLFPFFFMMLFVATGIYAHAIIPIVMSFAFYLPVVNKIYYMKNHVFDEVLES